MSSISWEEVTAKVKERLDIIDVVSQTVILKKKGQNYWGCCPFHNEKTPSFSVNPAKGIYKCFGCGAGGDVISFLMNTRNQSFIEVIKEQAEYFGIELPAGGAKTAEQKSIRSEVLKACEQATKYFMNNLFEKKHSGAQKAMEYLLTRDINAETIKTYRLGYALNEFDDLQKTFKKEFSDEVLEKAGLIIKRENGSYIDRFRHRIMIPIIDENDRVIAFGARALEEGQNPKYLNSPDTIIYNKSNIMYGIAQAKNAIKEEDSVVIMEGYFDVISAQAHGIKNCIASCGTSLTSNHIKLISRYCASKKIYLGFDMDKAGRNASNRGASIIKEELASLGNIRQFDENYVSTAGDSKYVCEIRVVVVPKGKDPDEFIRQEGAEKYKECLANAPLLLDFQINEILKNRTPNMSPIEKSRLVKELMPYLNEINNKIIQNEYILHVASTLNINTSVLQKELSEIVTIKNPYFSSNSGRIVKKSSNLSEKAQKNLLCLFMLNVDEIDYKNLIETLNEIEFTDEKLIIVKNTIDKIFFQVNNVKDLIQRLYTIFAENNEIKEIITELNDLSESFKDLNSKAYNEVIFENIKRIKDCRKHAIHSKLNTNCKNAIDDDQKARMFQQQLREMLTQNKTGET